MSISMEHYGCAHLSPHVEEGNADEYDAFDSGVKTQITGSNIRYR
jgi:hypothetical protein